MKKERWILIGFVVLVVFTLSSINNSVSLRPAFKEQARPENLNTIEKMNRVILGEMTCEEAFGILPAGGGSSSDCQCGDIDGDGDVDLVDFSKFSSCFGLKGPTLQCDAAMFFCSDLDGNGWVNLRDFNKFQIRFGLSACGSPPNCEGVSGEEVYGDGKILGCEECDDGNTIPGDGCDENGFIEDGWRCEGEPSVCTPELCGNGVIDDGEVCDGADLGGADCASINQGFNDGTLGCSDCSGYDVSRCINSSPPPNGLVSYWDLDELVDGQVFDVSNNTNDGIVSGGISLVTSDCVAGNCLSFDGDDDWIDIPFDSSLDVINNDGAFTLMVWVKLTTLDNVSILFNQEDSGGTGRSWLDILATGELNSPLVTDLETLSEPYFGEFLDEWHHVAITFDGENATGYIDGIAQSTVLKEDDLDEDCYGGYRIGVSKTGENEINGLLDEVVIYNVALSSDEINDYYVRTAPDYEILLLQMSDTHVMTCGDCGTGYISGYHYGNMPQDGRTCCPGPILAYVEGCEDADEYGQPGYGFPDNWETCPWLTDTGGWIAVPTAPNMITLAAVEKANADYDADYVFISGDLVAVAPNSGEDCGTNHSTSINLFASMMSNLEGDYFPIGAYFHDHVTEGDEWPGELCQQNYLDAFANNNWGGLSMPGVQGDALNWYFVDRDNLFIGLSETENDNNRFNDTFLESILSTYANKNMKVFITLHTPWACYDEYMEEVTGGYQDYTRCDPGPSGSRIEALYSSYYRNSYRVFVLLMGHTHATQWDQSDWTPGGGDVDIYHTMVTSIMTYPTEFRVIKISKNTINMSMSGSVDPAVDNLSLEILANHENPAAWLPETLYGEPWERDIFIDLLLN